MLARSLTFTLRQLSTSAQKLNLVQAPIQVFGVEGRYAHALYSAAVKEKQLESIENDLIKIKGIVGEDAKLSEYVANPTIKRMEKKETVEAILGKLGVSKLTLNLFGALAENGRLNKLNNVIGAFQKIMSAHKGEVVCTVITAKQLEKGEISELETAIKSFLAKGQTINLELKVNPDIVGGMIVNIGDKYVDMSMASKIKTYTELLNQAI